MHTNFCIYTAIIYGLKRHVCVYLYDIALCMYLVFRRLFVVSAAVDDDQQQDIKKEETKTPPNQKSGGIVRDSKDSENPSLPALSPVTPSLLPSTPHSPSLTLSPSLPLPPATPQPASPTSEPDKELAHRSASDVSVPKSPSKPQSFTPSRRRSSTSQGSSVNTRFRAQTAFENVS